MDPEPDHNIVDNQQIPSNYDIPHQQPTVITNGHGHHHQYNNGINGGGHDDEEEHMIGGPAGCQRIVSHRPLIIFIFLLNVSIYL